ncbi:hypothetical protein [Actinacidiphila acididurans]|uniref:Uncharacterized protein n=1 Tax=Actinacidiphila acididurans TaxID=2784346 RepID=A0ABS2TL35_9ACTN|nr:hypothetical protein [Actinacidiphila acididurans]MBM9504048.1 hypothetical protein [Actinacidiphila acididurans]
MSYDLKAVIAGRGLLDALTGDVSAARLVDLRQGLALLPMTDALSEMLTDASRARHPAFWSLPAGFDQVLVEWSRTGPVAYVEAEYFGGVGQENAAVWRDGELVLGPLHLAEGEPVPVEGTPVRQALRALGVSAGEDDEFTAAGLGAHRNNDEWSS